MILDGGGGRGYQGLLFRNQRHLFWIIHLITKLGALSKREKDNMPLYLFWLMHPTKYLGALYKRDNFIFTPHISGVFKHDDNFCFSCIFFSCSKFHLLLWVNCWQLFFSIVFLVQND